MSLTQEKQLDQYEPYTTQEANHRFDLSYIEFDEKGDYWDRRQLGWTAQALRRVAGRNDVVLVMYVHGWQNDASQIRGHDVGKFKCLLEHLAEADEGRHRFFGVYVAWRGKSVPGGDGVFPERSPLDYLAKGLFFVPHELSFFGRKNAATRVAGLPVTEALFQSVATTRKAARAGGHTSRTILVGHSFGALVLEKALAQALAAKIISEDENFTAPADFVVLLNSAGESIYAKEMIDMLRRIRPVGKGASGDEISAKHPLIVSITSKADWATGMLFPVGTQLSNATGHFRRYNWDEKYGATSTGNISQREYFTQTPGHNKRLISHLVRPVEGKPHPPNYEEQDKCGDEMLEAFQRNLAERDLVGPKGEIQFVTLGPGGEQTKWQLEDQIQPERLRTPYWIIQVPKDIIRDHSDIFNENALAMMARLFRVTNPQSEAGIMTTAPRTMRLAEPGQ
jgi:pimeloyl-ACP methyl ester carboxylesterase